MATFEFFSVPRIMFGRGQGGKIGEIAASFGRSVMLVHNGPVPEGIVEAVKGKGVRCTTVRQKGEPGTGDVDGAVALAREEKCEVVIGVGGGSAIDAGKAVAGLITNGGVALDYMEVVGRGQKIGKAGAPFIAVPTTAGTGAEATRNAVIGCADKKFKASIRSEWLLPRVAIVDPELAVGVAKEVTASSGMDALCQLIEAYTSTGANAMTDGLAIKGIGLAGKSLKRAYEDGGDLEAREGMGMAALLSGICLANAGLGAVHGFAAPLGANYPVPHGTVCAALLPGVMKANVRALREKEGGEAVLRKYAEIARVLAGKEDVDAGVEWVARLVRELGIPGLGRFGVTEGSIAEMVGLAKKASSMRYNPVGLAEEALGECLRAAIGG